MRRTWVILLVAVAVGTASAICRVDQEIAVAWIRLQSLALVETGQRVAYIRSLLEHGGAGRRAVRNYVAREWWDSPPDEYDICILYGARPAFIGLSEKELSKLIGDATRIEEREGGRDLVYDGRLNHIEDFQDQRPRLIFHLRTGRVANVSRWLELLPLGQDTNEFTSGWMEWLPNGELRKQESPNQVPENTARWLADPQH